MPRSSGRRGKKCSEAPITAPHTIATGTSFPALHQIGTMTIAWKARKTIAALRAAIVPAMAESATSRTSRHTEGCGLRFLVVLLGDPLQRLVELFARVPAAVHHHAAHLGDVRDVGQRIPIEQHEIGALAAFDRAGRVFLAEVN